MTEKSFNTAGQATVGTIHATSIVATTGVKGTISKLLSREGARGGGGRGEGSGERSGEGEANTIS